MPYNTRRKSLSLPSLGIQLPNSSRSSHRSPPVTTTEQQPPSKKVKRSHTIGSASPPPDSPLRVSTIKFRDQPSKGSARVAENTPPPSPGEAGNFKVDTQGIDDDIVVGVIGQLEKTGNRPHLLKELAAVLSNTLPIVESSANPSAIISSRLATYLRRSWSALSPCPVAKELIGTHPRRIYFFLTTCPRQPFPETVDLPTNTSRIISPSLSSAVDEEEEELDARARSQLSPSPEIDLSFPDLEDDSTSVGAPGASFSGREPLIRDGTHPPTTTNMAHNRRAVSPPLERDEREFTQTASSLQQRSRSQTVDTPPVPPEAPSSTEDSTSMSMSTSTSTSVSVEEHVPADDESEESAALRNSEAAAVLFGQADSTLLMAAQQAGPPFASSPALRPQLGLDMSGIGGFALDVVDTSEDVKMFDATVVEEKWSWTELKSPENVELDELDDLFESY